MLSNSPKHSLYYVANCTLLVIDQLYACYATMEDPDKRCLLIEEMLYLYNLPAVRQWLGL